MPNNPKVASVVLDLALDKTLDYSIPDTFTLLPGTRVLVPVRGKLHRGTIFELKSTFPSYALQPIHSVLSENPLISSEGFQLAQWMSSYYATSLQKVLKSMLPPQIRKELGHKEQLYIFPKASKKALATTCAHLRVTNPQQAALIDLLLQNKESILVTEAMKTLGISKSPISSLEKKGLISIKTQIVDRNPLSNAQYFKTTPKTLSLEQAEALKAILDSVERESYATHLLHGITGSGKTEVYLQAIDHVLKLGKSAIMLVPEIALTPQTLERFLSRFSIPIAILHHRLSPGERHDQWHKIHKGECRIIIGPRSAVLSPAQNLGVIIVDEEHEQSYKQSEESPCYQARDVAVMRGKLNQATVILGSATPSLESYYNAKKGKYNLLHLANRPDNATLPKVHVVDMREEYKKNKGLTTIFSEKLINGIKERYQRGEQTLLFLNRRGYHTALMCPSCGKSLECPNCSISLSYHKNTNLLSCHLCDYTTLPPQKCVQCQSPTPLRFQGFGTERVEKQLYALFPDIRCIRVDADTTTYKGSHHELFLKFRAGKADVLIGTQMIAKGLHFPEVTLVGVLNCDTSLQFPDFRASEHTFQLITQVAGRSGRGHLSGEVILQTALPDNAIIQLAAKQDYLAFFEAELSSRELFNYPPFLKLIKIIFKGKDEKQTLLFATQFSKDLHLTARDRYHVHPVSPCGYQKIQGHYRFQCLLRGKNSHVMSQDILNIKNAMPINKSISLFIDIDPSSTFF